MGKDGHRPLSCARRRGGALGMRVLIRLPRCGKALPSPNRYAGLATPYPQFGDQAAAVCR